METFILSNSFFELTSFLINQSPSPATNFAILKALFAIVHFSHVIPSYETDKHAKFM